MKYSRRAFLRASALIPGFALLGCDEPGVEVRLSAPPKPAKPPAELEAPLGLMRRDGLYGVLIRIPEEHAARVDLGSWLVRAVDGQFPDSQDLFVQAVFVCLRPFRYDALRRNATEGACLFDTARIPIDTLSWRTRGDPRWDEFGPAFRRLVQGTDDSLLRARAAKSCESASRTHREAMERLDEAGVRLLREHFVTLASWIVQERQLTTDATRAATLDSLIRSHLESADPMTEGRRLPYGVVAKWSQGCSSNDEPRDDGAHVTISCGMAMAPQPFRMFSRFLVPP